MTLNNVDFAVRVAAPLALEAYVFLYDSEASSLLDHAEKLRALPKVDKHNARAAASAAAGVTVAVFTRGHVHDSAYAYHVADAAFAAATFTALADGAFADATFAGAAAGNTLRLFKVENVPPALAIKAVTILDAEIQADPRWWADKQALFAFAASVVADLA